MPTKTTLSYNILLAALFVVVGVTSLLSKSWLLGAGFLCLGVSFLLLGGNSQAWRAGPRWRRAATIALQVVAAVTIVIGLVGSWK
ncbi:MAG TPA: hypothetical protein VKQ30_12880 [Ktedonobacterales bacterium]|nr:hypothetical protein [Ktedonobacterales bacterium]